MPLRVRAAGLTHDVLRPRGVVADESTREKRARTTCMLCRSRAKRAKTGNEIKAKMTDLQAGATVRWNRADRHPVEVMQPSRG